VESLKWKVRFMIYKIL